MASRNLYDLTPELRGKAETFLRTAKANGIDVLVTCTYRSDAEQEALYACGRTLPGKKVTNCRAGQSKHNATEHGMPAARAFDVVPLVAGKPVWDAAAPQWKTLGCIGRALGLEWAGDWSRMREYPHFQLPG